VDGTIALVEEKDGLVRMLKPDEVCREVVLLVAS
jgi:hypothetical protein